MAGFNAGTGMVWLCSILAGAIGLPPITLAQTAPSNIVPDGTLGAERSQVIQNYFGLPIEAIAGGAQRGQNLFHSFSQFNVSAGRGAYFAIPNDVVRNVLTRVTGESRSDILGTLGTFRPSDGSVRVPGVNLFLINPNGIVFGENASLDVGGSFFATTANAVQLGDAGLFSASQPTSSNLLNVNPSAFLFSAIAAQNLPEIVVRSRATQTVFGSNTNGLRVPDGQQLLLLGGNVNVNDGTVIALGGRVEIGAVAGLGTVVLNTNGSLKIPDSIQREDVLINNSGVAVDLSSGGDIRITARNISVLNGSVLRAGIRSGFGAMGNQAGSIALDATDEVRVEQASQIRNNVNRNAVGNGGNLSITTNSLIVTGDSQMISSISGEGNAGNIEITARDRVLFQNSNVFNRILTSGTGKGGNVMIVAPAIEIRDDAQLATTSEGIGDAGNIIINASTLEVHNGILLANTFGTGNAGNIQITARDRVLFQGTNTYAFSDVAATGRGRSGNVVIDAPVIEVRDEAQLSASTFGIGNAGNVQITARDRVLFQNSDVFSSVESKGTGTGGNVVIDTAVLEVHAGAQLLAYTEGRGNAGNIQITARDRVFLDGTNSTTGRSSGIFTDNGTPNTQLIGTGAGGNVFLTTPQLTISNGAVVDALTANEQPGGTISLHLGQLTLLSGGQIFTTSSGSGPAGTIDITATDQTYISGSDSTYAARLAQFDKRVIPINANSGIYVRSSSTGPAGNILLTTPRLTLEQQGRIDAQSATVSGGNIFLAVPSLLLLRNGSQISATAGTANPQASGNGGNINITSRFIVAIPKENSDITANATQGRGGSITIDSQGVFGLKVQPKLTPLSDITASSDVGLSGTVNLKSPDTSLLQNGLTEFPQTFTDTIQLLANSCIVRSRKQNGKFFITGSGGLPVRPGDAPLSPFPTGGVGGVVEPREQGRQGERREQGKERGGRDEGRGMRDEGRDEAYIIQNSTLDTQNSPDRPWKIGDPIVEPQGVYKLANGDLVMSRECP